MSERARFVFTEVQPFYKQPIFWVVWLAFSAFVFFFYVNDLIYGWLNYLVLGLVALNIILLFFARLITRIDDDAITIKMIPFHRKWRTYRWDEIATAEVITYRPIRDYGGWGIRFSGKGTAYNVYGNTGISLVMKNGKRYLVGTQRGDEVEGVLERG